MRSAPKVPLRSGSDTDHGVVCHGDELSVIAERLSGTEFTTWAIPALDRIA